MANTHNIKELKQHHWYNTINTSAGSSVALPNAFCPMGGRLWSKVVL